MCGRNKALYYSPNSAQLSDEGHHGLEQCAGASSPLQPSREPAAVCSAPCGTIVWRKAACLGLRDQVRLTDLDDLGRVLPTRCFAIIPLGCVTLALIFRLHIRRPLCRRQEGGLVHLPPRPLPNRGTCSGSAAKRKKFNPPRGWRQTLWRPPPPLPLPLANPPARVAEPPTPRQPPPFLCP